MPILKFVGFINPDCQTLIKTTFSRDFCHSELQCWAESPTYIEF